MVSKITVLMLQSLPVRVFDTAERTEAWTVKNDCLHALMLSCPHDKRDALLDFLEEIEAKVEVSEHATGRKRDANLGRNKEIDSESR